MAWAAPRWAATNATAQTAGDFRSQEPRLLTSESDAEALQIAQKLEQLNRQRREIEQEIFEEAKACVEESGESPVIVVGKRGWHLGVVGIVASRLVERYHRPAVVVAFDQEGVGKGSARSVPGFNVFEALAQCQEHLMGFGGHPAAAGLTVSSQAFSSLQEKMAEVVTDSMSVESKKALQFLMELASVGEPLLVPDSLQ